MMMLQKARQLLEQAEKEWIAARKAIRQAQRDQELARRKMAEAQVMIRKLTIDPPSDPGSCHTIGEQNNA